MVPRSAAASFAMVLWSAAGCGGGSSTEAPDAAPDAPPAPVCSTAWTAPSCAATDLEGKLRCIPGITVTPRPDLPLAGYTRYDLTLTQAVDHDHPEAGTFAQRLILMHASEDRPMILATGGYDLSPRSRIDELASMFGANEIWYEHRYFDASTPVSPDYQKLTIAQAAGDAHHIAEALRWLYPKAWVGTGVSKGGMTSVYHRRFFPCDVNATVAYVAPSSRAAADPAYRDFVANVGGSARAGCRADLRAYQRRLLAQRSAIVPLVEGTFTQLPVDEVYEMAVIELSFAFWQYSAPNSPTAGCAAIPPEGATPAQMLAFLESHSSPAGLASDATLLRYRAYYYQSGAQLGYPAPLEDGLGDLLRYPGADVAATFLPAAIVPTYDPAAMPDVDGWVKGSGRTMMFVYGELDPWSTRMFDPTETNDSHLYVAPGGNHGAKIAALSTKDRTEARATLARWIGVPPVAATLAIPAVDDDERRPR
jgi:PS-10 peptidase S37